MIGHVEDEEIITVNAAPGGRPGPEPDQWEAAPPPEDCEPVDQSRFVAGRALSGERELVSTWTQ